MVALLALLALPEAFAQEACDSSLLEAEGLVLLADHRVEPGQTFVLRAFNALPGERVAFLRGGQGDREVCPSVMNGLCLELPSPKLMGTAVADAEGVAQLELTPTEEAASQFISFQAATDACDGAVSNVVERQVLGDQACAFTAHQWAATCADDGEGLGCVLDAWFPSLYPEGFATNEATYGDAASIAAQLPVGSPFEAERVALKLNLDFDQAGVYGPRSALATEQVASGALTGLEASALLLIAESTLPADASDDLVEALQALNEGYANCDPAIFLAPGDDTCGNGVLEMGEECDDGNTFDQDGCSATCVYEFCGDGVLQCNEECDDGNNVDGDGCDSRCWMEDGPAGVSIRPPGSPAPGAGDPGDRPPLGGGDDTGAGPGPDDTGPGDTGLGDTGTGGGDDSSPLGDTGTMGDTGLGGGDGGAPPSTDSGFADSGPVDTGAPAGGGGGGPVGDTGSTPLDTGAPPSAPPWPVPVPVDLCGDGAVDPGETCDDGNLDDGDGCSTFCELEFCGVGAEVYQESTPVTPETDLVLTVIGEPGEEAYLVAGAEEGDLVVLLEGPDFAPETCAFQAFGTCSEVLHPIVLDVRPADANGQARIPLAPAGVGGGVYRGTGAQGITHAQATVVRPGASHRSGVTTAIPLYPPYDGKYQVCHLPPGYPENAHTLEVGSQAAVAAHLEHGDLLGPCEAVDDPTDPPPLLDVTTPIGACDDPTCDGEVPPTPVPPDVCGTVHEVVTTLVDVVTEVTVGSEEGTVTVTVTDLVEGEPILFLVGPVALHGPCPTQDAGLWTGQDPESTEIVALVNAGPDGTATVTLPEEEEGSDLVVVAVSPLGEGAVSEPQPLFVHPCGNGVVEPELGEMCDDGARTSGDGCDGMCQVEGCGDGVRQKGLGEQCDDGNLDDLDGCSSTCEHERCGDGVQLGTEECDDGNRISGDGCNAYCDIEYCGDGDLAPWEACDDGNDRDNDGCSAACVVEFCGDGIKQSGLGETCDDGNDVDFDGCRSGCIRERCGDGILQPDEECDDGNQISEDGCSAVCLEEYCGDGEKQRTMGETCDDGNHEDFDGCRADCIRERCGDGILQPIEDCDDGNRTGSDGCSPLCRVEFCGDDVRQDDEGCDDGNNDSDDGCSATCEREFCGDGVLQSGEACDDGNADAFDGCSASCEIEACGDGVVQPGEACDGGPGCSDTCTSTLVAMDAGGDHSCALSLDGLVHCWGLDGNGQASPPDGLVATEVVAGGYHSCALDSGGLTTCWGRDSHGQATPPADAFVQLSLGGYHSCALDAAGQATCWGRDDDGQASPPAGTWRALSAGAYHTCGVATDGSVACWGRNTYGQASPPAGTFDAVGAGTNHSCGLLDDGSLTCWGSSLHGRSSPPAGHDFVDVGAGYIHGCALDSAGSITCWGGNNDDQLDVPADSYTTLHVGAKHNCGFTTGGLLACWGDNDRGQTEPFPTTP